MSGTLNRNYRVIGRKSEQAEAKGSGDEQPPGSMTGDCPGRLCTFPDAFLSSGKGGIKIDVSWNNSSGFAKTNVNLAVKDYGNA